MPGRAFISYRRDDTSGYAGRVYDRLQQRFPDQIFMDVSGIDAGVDFVESIEREVRNSTVLIALIGKHWLEVERVGDGEDFVSHEIGLALENKITTIPVLLRGARMPSAAELPERLKPLARRNAFEIGEATFDRDMAALIRALEPKLGRKAAANWKLFAAAGALAFLLIVGGAAVALKSMWPAQLTPTPTPVPASPTASVERVSTPNANTPDSATTTFQFEPVGKWTVSTGGATAGAMTLQLKQDQNYEISNPQGTFQQIASVIGRTGTWTFNRSDMSLTILGTGSRYGLGFRMTGKQNKTFTATGVDGINYTFTPEP